MTSKDHTKRYILEQLSKESNKSTETLDINREESPLNWNLFTVIDHVHLHNLLEDLKNKKLINSFKIEYKGIKSEFDIDNINIKYKPSKIEEYLNEKYSYSAYKNISDNLKQEISTKMQKIIEIIEEEKSITSKEDDSYHLRIPKEKFTKADLILSDVLKILKIFSENENYWILPHISLINHTKDIMMIELPSIELYDMNFKNFKDSIGDSINANPTNNDKQPILDIPNKTLTYNKIIHKFQKGREKSPVFLLFKELWKERQIIAPGISKPKKGKPLVPETLAVQIGISETAWGLKKNREIREKFNNIVMNIKRILGKGFPIELSVKNGLQLIVKTKK